MTITTADSVMPVADDGIRGDLEQTGWSPIEWSIAESDNFTFLRDHSDETEVLASAIRRAVCEAGWLGLEPQNAVAVDIGGEKELGDRLRGLFGRYTGVPIDGPAAAARFLAGLRREESSLQSFDVCVLSHVLPYMADFDVALGLLARFSRRQGIGVAVLCGDAGDQSEVGRLALQYDPGYARSHDHALRFASFLGARAVQVHSFTVMSEARVTSPQALLRLIAFFLGTSAWSLVNRVASHASPETDGSYRLTSAHRVFAWPMRRLAEVL